MQPSTVVIVNEYIPAGNISWMVLSVKVFDPPGPFISIVKPSSRGGELENSIVVFSSMATASELTGAPGCIQSVSGSISISIAISPDSKSIAEVLPVPSSKLK